MTEGVSRCGSCGAVLRPGAETCPECGRAAGVRRRPVALIAGVILGLLFTILLLFLLRPRPEPSIALDTAPKVTGPPVTAAPPRPPAGPPVASAPTPPPVPEDPNRAAVAAYLERMREIELRRKAIVNNVYPAMLSLALLKGMGGMKDMLSMLDENVEEEQRSGSRSSTVEQAQGTMRGYRDQFRALAMEVQKVAPPEPARRFHNGYIVSLGRYDAVLGDIESAMLAEDQSIAGRGAELQGTVSQTLKATDDEMGRLLQRYNLQRTFSVSDEMTGSIAGG